MAELAELLTWLFWIPILIAIVVRVGFGSMTKSAYKKVFLISNIIPVIVWFVLGVLAIFYFFPLVIFAWGFMMVQLVTAAISGCICFIGKNFDETAD